MFRDPPPHMADEYPSSPGASSSTAQRPLVEENGFEEEIQVDDIFRDLSITEIMEELETRFLYNLPKVETDLVRLYWQAEQAHWFYEDYIRPLNPELPTMTQKIFTHALVKNNILYRLYGGGDNDDVWDAYCDYKKMVPCCGGILINAAGDKCLMVRGWKSNAGWCFPRGKINSQEYEIDCAIREVQEETGFDLTGLVDPDDRIQTQIAAQVVTMFIVGGIDENTSFETQTRMEIGAIEWVNLIDLPTWIYQKKSSKATPKKGKKFYNVTPFVGPIKQWLLDRGYSLKPAPKPPNSGLKPPNPASKPKSAPKQPTFAPSVGPTTLPATQSHPAETPDRSSTARLSPLLTSSSTASSMRDQQTTALDSLFSKFVQKQAQDLPQPSEDPALSEDERGGLQRLFDNLEAVEHESGDAEQRKVEKDEAEQREEEEDALASLLGTIAVPTSNPVRPFPQQPLPSDKAAKLLAMLQARPSATSRSAESSPTPITASSALDHLTLTSHHASLLSVLSAAERVPSVSVSERSRHPTLLTGEPSSEVQRDDIERSRKQLALLEQITAGIVDSIPVPKTLQTPWDRTTGPRAPFPHMPLTQAVGPGGAYPGFAHQQTTRTHSNGVRGPQMGYRGDVSLMPLHDASHLPGGLSQGVPRGIPAPPRPMPLGEQQRSLLGALFGVSRPLLPDPTSRPPAENVPYPVYSAHPQFLEHRGHYPIEQQACPPTPFDSQHHPLDTQQTGFPVRLPIPNSNFIPDHMPSTQILPGPVHSSTVYGLPSTAAVYTKRKPVLQPPPGQPYAHPTHLALQMALNAPVPGPRLAYHHPVPRPPNGMGGPGGALGVLMDGNGEFSGT